MAPSRSRGPDDRPSQPEDHDRDDDEDSPLEDVIAGITIGAILTVAFGLLALGVPWFWIVFPIGFAGVLPAVIGLTKLYERRRRQRADDRPRERADDSQDALETLRDRYARGELSDEAFERQLERLVATESREDAARIVRDRDRRRADREAGGERGEDADREMAGEERDEDTELEESTR